MPTVIRKLDRIAAMLAIMGATLWLIGFAIGRIIGAVERWLRWSW